MSFFALNLVLAVIWVFLSGSFTLRGGLIGFVIGFMVITLHQSMLGSHSYSRAVVGMIKLLAVFIYRLWLSSLQLARDILRRRNPFSPAIIAYEAPGLSRTDIVLLSILISLTPGSLSLDADVDRGIIYVHALYGHDTKRVRQDIEIYSSILRTMRGVPAEGEA